MNYEFLVGHQFLHEHTRYTASAVRLVDGKILIEALPLSAGLPTQLFAASLVLQGLDVEEIELFQTGGLAAYI